MPTQFTNQQIFHKKNMVTNQANIWTDTNYFRFTNTALNLPSVAAVSDREQHVKVIEQQPRLLTNFSLLI